MKQFINKLIKIFFTSIIVVNFNISQLSASLDYEKGVERVRKCVKGDSNPVSGFGGTFAPKIVDNKPNEQALEYEFILENKHCGSMMAIYAGVKVALQAAMISCEIPGFISPFPKINIDLYRLAQCTKKAASNPSNFTCVTSCATANSSYMFAFIAAMGIQFERAKKFYNKTQICGSDWIRPSEETLSYSNEFYKRNLRERMNSSGAEKIDCSGLSQSLNQSDERGCREFFYQGIEFEDNPSSGNACLDPLSNSDKKIGNEKFPRQRYYMRGLEAASYNCEKYKYALQKYDYNETKYSLLDLTNAYECCIDRSSNYMCLEYTNCASDDFDCIFKNKRKGVFCKAGLKCSLWSDAMEGQFDVKFQHDNSFICANSYNFCPFNFSVGGGSSACDQYSDIVEGTSNFPNFEEHDPNSLGETQAVEYNGEDRSSEIRNSDGNVKKEAGKCKNYCQHFKHCTLVSNVSDPIIHEYSPYMSRACINLIGDSKNIQSYNSGFFSGKVKNFSAPISQCVKETIENLFYNRVGHSKCANTIDQPDSQEICKNGYAIIDNNLVHQKGSQAKEKSFFDNVQKAMKNIVKMTLIISITIYGITILAGMRDITKRKEILVYVFKIAIIIYFTFGNAWKDTFFEGIYSTSAKLSSILFKIAVPKEEKRDGCQFGIVVDEETGVMELITSYPEGKEYLAIWDTLDCKIARYLGFGADATVANIFLVILAGFFTGPIGLYFSLAISIFGIYLIVIAIKALHIFIGSAISIVILVFISPIVFLMLLFEKTKEGFKKWLMLLISFALQPVIMSAYIFIVVVLMDNVLLGSATFSRISPEGQNPQIKSINCSPYCSHPSIENGKTLYKTSKGAELENYEKCLAYNQFAKIENPNNDSVACIIESDKFGTIPGFEIIGLSIPILTNLLSGDVSSKMLTLLKAAFIIYILNKFISEIPGICGALTGSQMQMSNLDGNSIFKRAAGVLNAMSKRVRRGMLKGGKKAYGLSRKRMQKRGEIEAKSPGGNHSASRSGAGDHDVSRNKGDD